MAAAVLPSMQGLTLDREIMPPSPVSQNSTRHGRSRHGGSMAKSKARGRGYSVVDEREGLIAKALSRALKRTVEEDDKQEEGDGKLVADSEGWVDCEEVLEQPTLAALQVTLSELQALVSSPSSKSRFSLKPLPEAEKDSSDASDYLIRANPIQSTQAVSAPTAATLIPLTTESDDIPDLIIYETSYANYPLILASGGIKRAGGQAHLQFSPLKIQEDGTEIRPSNDIDVSIYIDLRAVMAANDKITWARAENGNILTEGDAIGAIDKKYWKRVVARRADIGILYEDGEVRKEVPIGLRGKGVKGKRGGGKGKTRGLKEMKATSEDDSTGSD
ncbi:hypothetical protein OIDMADRAFT_113226 [Oidiodendron maius Zn]|uniref:tRNA 2'-phosphotransferase 1 n=1 Tax=Oidiodendron maius (strain Zn) TaxID=913774 RepID=A0A0C3D585_OIDMZ|nr:hypothetical protein OIDMADRAFT_113226 [Oidiodendron maius Zn]